jgi:sigma-E factor negative regulatory protein RseC
MIEELATVIAINGQVITVESQIKSSCSSCKQVSNCGNGQVAQAIPQRKLTMELHSSQPFKIGEHLVLGIPEKNLLTTAWQVYFWPIFGLIISSAIGEWLLQQGIFNHEFLSILLGLSGGYLGYRFAKFCLADEKNAQALLPKILRKLPEVIKVTEISH